MDLVDLVNLDGERRRRFFSRTSSGAALLAFFSRFRFRFFFSRISPTTGHLIN